MLESLLPRLRHIWDFVVATADNYVEHRVAVWAAALAYYGLFSIFPLLLFLIYLGSEVLASPGARDTLHEFMVQAIPAGVDDLTAIVNQTLELRGPIGLIGAIGLIWSASAVFAALEGALNRIWGGRPRPFWGRRLLASASILLLSVAFILLLTASQFVPLLVGYLPLVGGEQLSGLMILVGLVAVLYMVHRSFPNRKVGRWPALVAALFSGLALTLARNAFDTFLNSAFVNYGAVYGSLAWIVSLGIWTYIAGTLFLLGAEIGHTLDERGAFDALEEL